MGDPPRPKSLMKSLGEFVGHITRAVTTPVPPPPKTPAGEPDVQSRRHTEEQTVYSPDGKRMILRRTVIEEVEMQPPTPRENDPPRPSV
jgi:hypothetical protein